MKTKAVIIVLGLLFLATTSFAQIFGPWFRFHDGWFQRKGIARLYEELKLTDEQKSKLQDLSFEFRKKQADVAGKLNKARIELQELLSAEKPDKTAIDRKIDEISGYVKEMMKNRTEHWLNIQQVLTPEQKKVLKERSYFRGWANPGGGRFKFHRPW